jgi:hypothetical protein
MALRTPGYYWVTWTDLADADCAARRPGPLVGHWDGAFWWFFHSDVYRFDCEVEVLDEISAPSRQAVSTLPPAKLQVAQS